MRRTILPLLLICLLLHKQYVTIMLSKLQSIYGKYPAGSKERQIILLNILRYELRFNLEYQHSFRKLYGHDRREPCPVSAACKVVSQDGLTLCPLLFNRLH